MKRNLPNIFTIARAALAPVFMALLLAGSEGMTFAAVIVFVVAAYTDYLDGWLARRYNVSSAWGTLVDPLADKVLTTSAFIAFALMNLVAWWMVALVIVRDVATTLFRSYADSAGRPLVTSWGAKAKTFTQMAFIVIVLVFLCISQWRTLPAWLLWMNVLGEFVLMPLAMYWTMLCVTIVTVWTGVEYFLVNRMTVRRACVRLLRQASLLRRFTVRRRAKI
jgi:CDP-diacylglycerol---glycerol-3-phosphate 3-phosphatidyltransferase